MKKIIILVIAGILAVGGVSFYGGMMYGKGQSAPQLRGGFAQFSGSLPAGGSGMIRRNGGGGIVGGEIISKDAQSITIKMQDTGSKIVFFSSATKVTKSVEGSLADLVVGESVTVNGTANTDGSITAQSIQLRPEMAAPKTSQ